MVSFILGDVKDLQALKVLHREKGYLEAAVGEAKYYLISRNLKTSDLEDILLTAACKFADCAKVRYSADLIGTSTSGNYIKSVRIGIEKGDENLIITSKGYVGPNVDVLEIAGRASTETVDLYVKIVKEMILNNDSTCCL